MKKSTLLYFLLLAGISCAISKPVKLKGEIANIDEGATFYLYDLIGEKTKVIDSANVKKGKVEFSLDESERQGLYLVGASHDKADNLVFMGEEISFKMDRNTIGTGLGISEDEENQGYAKILNYFKTYEGQIDGFNKEYAQIAKIQAINPNQFNQGLAALRTKFKELQVAKDKFFADLAKETTSTWVKKQCWLYAFEEGESKESFVTKEDVQESGFSGGPILRRLITMYYMNFAPLSAESALGEFQQVINYTLPGTEGRQSVYGAVIAIALTIDQNVARALNKQHVSEFDNWYSSELSKSVPKGPPAIGDVAPDIEMKSPDGVTYKLSDLKGKVVLLDFWASWCGPCRREMPNVVKAYEKYKEKGFTVYSVSLDGSMDRWKGAIVADGMTWPYHVSDLKKWGNQAARAYHVSGIPATYLIDKNGVIVAQNLRGYKLDEKLGQLFAGR